MELKKFKEFVTENDSDKTRFNKVFDKFKVRNFAPHFGMHISDSGFRLDGKVDSKDLLKALEDEFTGYRFSYGKYEKPGSITGLTWTEVNIHKIKDTTELMKKLKILSNLETLELSDRELNTLEDLIDKILKQK